ncbi:hypothetical protein CLV32_1321 [Pedobacter duraquae]|uniref:Uncharacterized protein n=1 Tax=Pedobacter duraquae TaxID=425511 RepID=A0A4R6IK09_9SPHI|nr:hypothetical protein CLV32_1321 [Pedobacter duraquae]
MTSSLFKFYEKLIIMKNKSLKIVAKTLFVYKSPKTKNGKRENETDPMTNTVMTTTSLTC